MKDKVAVIDYSSLADKHEKMRKESYLIPEDEIGKTAFAVSAVIHMPPTTILSKAIEQIEQMGDYKVMVALVDLDKSKSKEERLHTFCDIESKKLREVIYKEIENESN